MPTVSDAKTKSNTDPKWYEVADLIAGICATPTRKMFLTLVWRHRNIRKGYAWASQESLAKEMGVSLPTVERAVAWAKKLGVIGVRRVRTGKKPEDQHNEYWLNIDTLKRLQRKPEHPSSVTGDDEGKQPSSSTPNTHHSEAEHPSSRDRTPITSDGKGFEVKQVVSKAENTRGAVSNGAAPAIYTTHPKLEYEKQKLVETLTYFLRSDAQEHPERSPQVSFDLFRQEANALAMDWNEIQSLWKTILKAAYPDQVVQPKPKPIPPLNKETLAAIASEAEGCLAAYMEPGETYGVLLYPEGHEVWVPGDIDPSWFPWDEAHDLHSVLLEENDTTRVIDYCWVSGLGFASKQPPTPVYPVTSNAYAQEIRI